MDDSEEDEIRNEMSQESESSLAELLRCKQRQHSSSVAQPWELLAATQRLSGTLAKQLRQFTPGVLHEAGSLMVSMMDRETCTQMLELLMPWAGNTCFCCFLASAVGSQLV